MYKWNLLAGWLGILAGFVTGALQGIFFARADWLGGYASWPRRMLRLGHIALIALGLINIAFFATAEALHFGSGFGTRCIALGFLAGHATMPVICYLAAYRTGFRQLFFIPTACLLGGAGALVWRLA